MKFWNKSKKYRETWTKMEGPGFYEKDKLKKWCQDYPSTNRFYFSKPKSIGSVAGRNLKVTWTWYFEDPEDALVFKLKFLTK